MSFISGLKSFATKIGGEVKTGAKQAVRDTALPGLIAQKSAQLLDIDQKLGKLGWSASPDVKAAKASLTQQRTQVQGELTALQAERKQRDGAAAEARSAQNQVLRNLR